ncbi:MAG: hypothetical protein IKZ59_01110 [Clostridia bacterium]|nr:hypothetical protein [Clostridia bacterium]
MKKVLLLVISALFVLNLCSCAKSNNNGNRTGAKTVDDILNEAENGGYKESETSPAKFSGDGEKAITDKKCDIDLTAMDSNMVTATVNDFYANPENYIGKIIKARGTFDVYEAETRNYYLCVMTDPTGCCSPSVEFLLKNERKYPDEFPAKNETVTVIGEFETYLEDGKKYCQLKDSLIN